MIACDRASGKRKVGLKIKLARTPVPKLYPRPDILVWQVQLLLLLSAFWPKYLSGRMALWYFFHGKNSQVHYIRHVCQVRLSRKVNKIIEF